MGIRREPAMRSGNTAASNTTFCDLLSSSGCAVVRAV